MSEPDIYLLREGEYNTGLAVLDAHNSLFSAKMDDYVLKLVTKDSTDEVVLELTLAEAIEFHRAIGDLIQNVVDDVAIQVVEYN